MAFRITKPLRALLGYLRGDDIQAANARILARNQAERAAATTAADAVPAPEPPVPVAERH